MQRINAFFTRCFLYTLQNKNRIQSGIKHKLYSVKVQHFDKTKLCIYQYSGYVLHIYKVTQLKKKKINLSEKTKNFSNTKIIFFKTSTEACINKVSLL